MKRITVRDVLEAVLDLRECVEAGFIRIESRQADHDRRFGRIEGRVDRVDERLARLEAGFGRLERRLDHHEDRISALEEPP
ncbi:MAG TPA: hypothetical protein VE591_15520 [Candidatus Acidoferrum sp.]|nr:hypothetical protein [Candidatus Acidoferrum sp.]